MEDIKNMVDEETYEKLRKTFRIRKLTPTECFLLQGMKSEDVEKARSLGVSDSKLYQIAGNGLVTNCVQYIAEHLYKSLYDDDFVTTDEKMVADGYGVE